MDTDSDADTDDDSETGDGPVEDCTGQEDFTPCLVTTDPDYSYDICIDELCLSPACGENTGNPPSPHFKIPDTNQRSCSDAEAPMECTSFPCNPDGSPAFCGQDAQYGWDTSHAATERFTRDTATASGEPLVTDNVTGLIWQGCAYGLTGDNCTAGTAEEWSQCDHLEHCDSLDWGGYTDWRLPDVFELFTLVDANRIISPIIDADAFPETPMDAFSTSSSRAGTAGGWCVDFAEGKTSWCNAETCNLLARCVRGGPAEARHLDVSISSGERVVEDTHTGLLWQGCAAGQSGDECGTGGPITVTWQEALAYCEGLSWGGYGDWRLPSVVELQSIVSYRSESPAIDTTAFPAMPSEPEFSGYWSSTTASFITEMVKCVSFLAGYVGDANKVSSSRYTRCVRGGE